MIELQKKELMNEIIQRAGQEGPITLMAMLKAYDKVISTMHY